MSRTEVEATAEAPTGPRTPLAVLALIAGGAVPTQLITLSFAYAQYLRGVQRRSRPWDR